MELLNSIGVSIVAFVFVLGVMIFVHELGHYLVAKQLGIRVEVFSLGFGRRLFGFKRGDTDYRVSLLPLGGYVKMAGENYDEKLTGEAGEFMSHSKLHRFAVAIAGPLMNIGLALVLVVVSFLIGVPTYRYLHQPAVIGSIEPESPAAQVGLQRQDIIVSIDGDLTETWQDVEILVSMSANQELHLTVKREDTLLQKSLTPVVAKELEVGTIGVTPFVDYTISRVEPETPAARAGLQPGDEILRVVRGTQTAVGFYESLETISSSQGEPLLVEVRRGGQIFERTITPAEIEGRWRIGTVVDLVRLQKYGLLVAIQKSLERNYRLTSLTFNVLGRIITGRTSVRTLSGPIEIARYSGRAASTGGIQLLSFMAFVSLQLGILNLMPIPILDGGVIALLALEGLMRRDISISVKERIFQVGFIFLMVLMAIVIFNDIAKTLPD
ncbi:MAG: RIP metalloprotease RseP [Acidobacteriota bacterium]